MSTDPVPWSSDWTVGLRVWVERAGQAVLGKGRLELLEGIERWHSISAAARQLGMSYRRAWLLVQSVNNAAGQPLVVAATGGSHGGGAALTPQGRLAVNVFRELHEQLQRTAAGLLPRLVQAPAEHALHLAAAATLEDVVDQLLVDYALQRPALRIRAVFGASDELTDQVLAGAPIDVLLAADARQLDRLEAAQLLAPGTRTILAENRLVALGRPEIASAVRRPADLLRPDLGRIALARASCPLGEYTRAYLESVGLYQTLLPRALFADNARAVVALVRAGQADFGLAYASDAATAEGCRLGFRVGRGPLTIRHTGAVIRRSQQPEQAKALLDFLTSRAAAARFRRCGFLPVRREVSDRRSEPEA
jgi:molybdate transport system substrate-binding protein